MKTALITGANRGLGLGMIKHLLKENRAESVIATCRTPSEDLKQLAVENKKLQVLHLDVSNIKFFDEFAGNVAKIIGDRGLNLLVNNAGVSTKFTKIGMVKAEQLLDNLTVNTVAPIMLTKALIPLLKAAADADGATVINMSSILGSIAKNDQGGFYPYRCSKAALNAATKSMSIDLKKEKIIIAAMHPGWVRTDMGGKNAPLDVDTSIQGILQTIQKLQIADSGKFYQYDGTELPW